MSKMVLLRKKLRRTLCRIEIHGRIGLSLFFTAIAMLCNISAGARETDAPADTFLLIENDSVMRIVAQPASSSFYQRWQSLYKRHFKVRPIGLTIGYSLKWYSYTESGRHRNCNFFGENGWVPGLVFGVPYQPHLYRGLGLDTGVFGEVYACKDGRGVYRVEDFGMFIPVRAMYRVPFKRDMSAYVTTGVSFDIGLRMNLKIADDTSAGTQKLNYDEGTPRRFNTFYDIGAGFRAGPFQFTGMFSFGMMFSHRFFSTNGTGENYLPVRTRKVTLSASLLF